MNNELLLLIFLLRFTCSQALSSSDHTGIITSKHGNFELSDHLLQEKQLQGFNGTIGLNEDGVGRHLRSDIDILKEEKIGKGPNGSGSDILRRPKNSSHSGASSLPARHTSFTSRNLVQLSIPSLLAFIFFF